MQSLVDQEIRIDGRNLLEHRNISISRSLEEILTKVGGTILTVKIIGPYDKPRSKTKLNFALEGTKKNEETAKILTNIFEGIIILPENSSLDIFVSIKQEDGSVLIHAVNSVSVALCCFGVNMKSLVFGITVGLYGSNLILDILESEEKKGHLNFVFSEGKCLYLKSYSKVSEGIFLKMVELAEKKEKEVYELFSKYLKEIWKYFFFGDYGAEIII